MTSRAWLLRSYPEEFSRVVVELWTRHRSAYIDGSEAISSTSDVFRQVLQCINEILHDPNVDKWNDANLSASL